MKKIFSIIIMLLILVLSMVTFAGCGEKTSPAPEQTTVESGAGESGGNGSPSAPTEQETPAPEEKGDEPSDDGKIKVDDKGNIELPIIR